MSEGTGRTRRNGPSQAIRIEVNGELKILEQTVRSGVSLLKKGGRMSVITFHSLEDRIIKTTFADLQHGCTCPKDFPVCVCGKKAQVRIITKKPILPTEEETAANRVRAAASSRCAEKII